MDDRDQRETTQGGGSAVWISRRADGTFGELEVLDDLSIRVYSGDELKAEAKLQEVAVFSVDGGEEVFDFGELQEEALVPQLVPAKECRAVKVGTSGFRCDKYTCRDGDTYCQIVGIMTPQGSAGGCLCRRGPF
jgi:hypothetical protein